MEQMIQEEAFAYPLGKELWLRGKVMTTLEQGVARSPKPVLILVHGFKSFMDWGFYPYTSKVFAEQGFYTVRFNFSCNGVKDHDFDELEKFAVNTYSREQEDLEELLKLLKARRLPFADQADLEHISLLGHSRGGGGSLIFASEHPEIKRVVTWNGIAKPDLFDEAFKEEMRQNGVAYVANARTKQQMPMRPIFYEDLERNADRFDIVRILHELPIPVLSVQADQDSDRLKQGFVRLRESAPHQSFEEISGTGHTFGAVHPFAGTTPHLEEALQASIGFLKQI